MRTLILGGARSGKTRLAQQLAADSALAVTYIATAGAGDAEMAARIARHREDRPAHWQTVECPHQLSATLRALAAPERCLLVDCLTLWLSNLLQQSEQTLARECAALGESVSQLPGRIILVANETGLGVVPLGALTRRFVDEAGRLHQQLARRCDEVLLCVAGLPLTLKSAAGPQ
ncbi:adenosylcobinamide kinase /adenosylcobinamide-phosphate guanylyltransferase [Solimonas aquatica]|uniref:Bifunctional adenosylcobalamin biosynthesis protein n=1 Tax=Solimonas aquatica TaxID=489703 RepID=A0A1H8ZV53_9GAMM|nr:bifunctional adenosylcobinamide kinase/adenosylcobinamide-phosphate guanylyltransferase [Solimonas aquatica]SEP68320.1 adenosylcobinamide kinase /adenosylcobinamide-phosphate guanylyltransferase [Solimonas aquatica]